MIAKKILLKQEGLELKFRNFSSKVSREKIFFHRTSRDENSSRKKSRDENLLRRKLCDKIDEKKCPGTKFLEEKCPRTKFLEEKCPRTKFLEEKCPRTKFLEEKCPGTKFLEEKCHGTKLMRKNILGQNFWRKNVLGQNFWRKNVMEQNWWGKMSWDKISGGKMSWNKIDEEKCPGTKFLEEKCPGTKFLEEKCPGTKFLEEKCFCLAKKLFMEDAKEKTLKCPRKMFDDKIDERVFYLVNSKQSLCAKIWKKIAIEKDVWFFKIFLFFCCFFLINFGRITWWFGFGHHFLNFSSIFDSEFFNLVCSDSHTLVWLQNLIAESNGSSTEPAKTSGHVEALHEYVVTLQQGDQPPPETPRCTAVPARNASESTVQLSTQQSVSTAELETADIKPEIPAETPTEPAALPVGTRPILQSPPSLISFQEFAKGEGVIVEDAVALPAVSPVPLLAEPEKNGTITVPSVVKSEPVTLPISGVPSAPVSPSATAGISAPPPPPPPPSSTSQVPTPPPLPPPTGGFVPPPPPPPPVMGLDGFMVSSKLGRSNLKPLRWTKLDAPSDVGKCSAELWGFSSIKPFHGLRRQSIRDSLDFRTRLWKGGITPMHKPWT